MSENKTIGKKLLSIALLCVLVIFSTQFSYAAVKTAHQQNNNILTKTYSGFNYWPKERKLWAANIFAIGFVVAYGFAQWDYGSTKWTFKNEGWFGKNTIHGGMDKLGHAYSSYLVARLVSKLYMHWGFQRNEAAKQSALTSFITMTAMEIGDMGSSHGFSPQDFIANTVGVITGYLFVRYPEVANRLDYRMEYVPTSDWNDPFTDYDGQRYILALKFSGFMHNPKPSNLWQYLEFDLGYYARERGKNLSFRRYLFAGVGINLSQAFKRVGWPKVGSFFNYYQMPGTYVPIKYSLRQ